MSKQHYTIELPPAIARRVNRTAKKQRRKPSEIAVEAIEQYFILSRMPEETPTAAEKRAIRRGEAALTLGDSVTLDEFRRHEEMARRPRRARAKVS